MWMREQRDQWNRMLNLEIGLSIYRMQEMKNYVNLNKLKK